jgi:hypothetical protein
VRVPGEVCYLQAVELASETLAEYSALNEEQKLEPSLTERVAGVLQAEV